MRWVSELKGWVVFLMLAASCASYGQKPVPFGHGTLRHLKIYYIDLDAETRAAITPKFMRKVGDVMELRDPGEIRSLRNLLRDARIRAGGPPEDLRLLIDAEGQNPVYMDGNGDISQGKQAWQMEPHDFLLLYFQLEKLDKTATKRK